jgi:hypothetical protein
LVGRDEGIGNLLGVARAYARRHEYFAKHAGSCPGENRRSVSTPDN